MEAIVGTNKLQYPEKRNFAYSKNKYTYLEERDIFSTLLNQYFRLDKRVHPSLQYLFYRPFPSKVKIRHFFNTISFNTLPWIVTFETTLPRLGNVHSVFYDLAIKQLASNNCKKIIALSRSAYDMQVQYLQVYYPQFKEIIVKKMIVLHPPQQILIQNYSKKVLPKKRLVFSFVGSDFFRKGGKEVLYVFDKLIPLYSQLELNIVSKMLYGDYASQTTKSDYTYAMNIIKKYPKNINHHDTLSNEAVLKLFKNTHIGLLPTWGDSYGYSVLEAQASGCPVITTDIRALPEINNNNIGWIINVPKLRNGDGKIATLSERIVFKKILEDQLNNIILEILHNFDSIAKKGILSLENIKNQHNLIKHRNTLSKIYEKSLI